MFSTRILLTSALLFSFASNQSASALDLYLGSVELFPGRLWLSQGAAPERILHSRLDRPNPAYPNAVMNLSQVAVSSTGKVYFCSGLDGCLMHLLDGRHEIMIFEEPMQIRDIACTGEDEVVYFSVVPTPQNGEPLADGKIYRRHLGEGSATLVATIPQSEVGGNWWGTFIIRDGAIILSTFEDDSKIYKVSGGVLTHLTTVTGFKLKGISVGENGKYYFVAGTGKVYETEDFSTISATMVTTHRLSDVAIRAQSSSPRP